jgi:predicted oxidoreductase
MTLVPSDKPTELVISKVELRPIKPADKPGIWWKFLNSLRQTVGMKPLELVVRFGEAKVVAKELDNDSKDVDNQVKLLQAKADYERVQAEIRERDRASQAKADREAVVTRGMAAGAQIQEWAAQQLKARKKTPDQLAGDLMAIKHQIEVVHGGRVELELPPVPDHHSSFEGDPPGVVPPQ